MISLIVLVLGAENAFGQEKRVTVRGVVTDASTGRPLVGANVILKRLADAQESTPQGVATDVDGYYQLPQVVPGRYRFTVSFIGYRPHRDTLRLRSDSSVVTVSVQLLPSEQQLDEVVVEAAGGAAQVEAGRQKVRPEDVERVPTPSASGDLATYLKTLPGVVSTGDRGGQLFIRGGNPSQNLVLVDQTPIQRPFHILGFYSAFPDDLVSSSTMHAGGFGAQYTGRLSSVIDVTMRPGNKKQIGGAATLSPFITGLRVEGPLGEDGVSLIGSFRRSLVEETAPSLIGKDVGLQFGDAFAKLHSAWDNGNCSMTGMYTYDRGKVNFEREDIFRWSNTLATGRCRAFVPNSAVSVDINAGFSKGTNEVGSASAPERRSSTWQFRTEIDLTRPLWGSELNWGLWGRGQSLGYSLQDEFLGLGLEEQFIIGAGGYVGTSFEIAEGFQADPSLAVSLHAIEYRPSIEPRLRLSWTPRGRDGRQTFNGAIGWYEQPVSALSDERDLGSPFRAWVFDAAGGAPPGALHALLGWQRAVGRHVDLSLEGYYKHLQNLLVPGFNTSARFTTELRQANGTVYGGDLRLVGEYGPFYGYLGYGYSWVEYRAARGSFGQGVGEPIQRYHPPHDRRHTLNAVLTAEKNDYEISVRWKYGSGLPYTPIFGIDREFSFFGIPRAGSGSERFLFDRPFDARLPDYHRLDISAQRTIEVGGSELTLQAGAMNLYDRNNLFYYDLLRFERVNQLPLFPYLSLEVGFR